MDALEPETNQDLTVQDLLDRGWTRNLIEDFLGEEDYRNPVDHFRNYSGKKMFSRRRVERVEASRKFENAFLTSAGRRRLPTEAVDQVRNRIASLRARMKSSTGS